MNREVLHVLDEYQKARMEFVHQISALALRTKALGDLCDSDAVELILQLMKDPVPAIQYSSIGALGSLVGFSTACAEKVIAKGHLGTILDNLNNESKNHRKAALFALKNLAKVSDASADAIMGDARTIPGILTAIRDSDISVKESGVWALTYVVKRSPESAGIAIECGCLPLIRSVIDSNHDLPLLRISISLLGDIARHNESLAEQILKLDVVRILVEYTGHSDTGMRKQATACLSQLVKHSAKQATLVSSCAQFFHTITTLLKDNNITVRRNACIILREICERSSDLAASVVEFGFVPLLGSYMKEASAEEKLPAITCLGHIASHSDTMAKGLIVSNLIPTICSDLIETNSNLIRTKLVWLIGQISKHSNENCKSLNEHGALTRVLALYMHSNTSHDLRFSCKEASEILVRNTDDCEVLDRLLAEVPSELRVCILSQLAKLLPHNMNAKKKFVQSGALQRILSIKHEIVFDGSNPIEEIRRCFPNEVLEFFEPSGVTNFNT